MLTDDELTHEIGATFQAVTHDLTYTGRRRPPRSRVLVAVPIAAAAAVLAGVAVVVTSGVEPTSTGAQAAPTSPVAAPTAMISESIELAGFTFRYERPVGSPDPLRAEFHVDRLPENATPVPLDASTAQAWVGVDPASGDNAIYIKSGARNGGELFALLSSSWSQDQLVDLLKNGSRN
jgi:hypothetical protein